jgi:predicted transcriptional regulator
MGKKLLELAVDIVHAQASMSKMTGEDIEQALVRVYNTLHKMRLAEDEGQTLLLADPVLEVSSVPDAADPGSSIQEDRVICMECRAEFRQLTANHLRIHHLSPREYKKKWGFALKQPLSAKMLTKLRSRSAKKRGLPEKLKNYLDQKRENKTRTDEELSTGGAAPGMRSLHSAF